MCTGDKNSLLNVVRAAQGRKGRISDTTTRATRAAVAAALRIDVVSVGWAMGGYALRCVGVVSEFC